MSVSFKDRVAIVTGGAGALGSSFCILLAKLGCKVVVNDLGTSVHGDASNASPAAKLVEKIKSGGGVAIADTHDVCDGPAIIAATLSAFGRIDIIIHCAGILHDASFAKTTLAHWNDILKVHLTAGMALAQAAWPHMSKQKYGRLLFVGSTSGLYGNFGQSGYSSAKMGVWGLAHTLAIEGEKHGIHANVIVPTAISRMTESLMPADIAAQLAPQAVAPIAVYMVSQECRDSGVVVEAGAGWAGKTRLQRSKGYVLPSMLNSRGTGATPDPSSVTVNSVRDNWAAISDFSHADIVSSGTQALGIILERRAEALKAGPSQGDARRDANKAKTASTGVSPATPAGTGAGQGNGWESARIMAVLKEHLDAEVVKRVKSVFVFDIEKEGSRRRWMLDAKSGEGSLQEVTGAQDTVKPDVTLTLTDAIFVKLLRKEATAQKLFMSGKLKVRGSIATAMKFEQVLRSMEHRVQGKL